MKRLIKILLLVLLLIILHYGIMFINRPQEEYTVQEAVNEIISLTKTNNDEKNYSTRIRN